MKTLLLILLLGLCSATRAQVAITNDASLPDPSAMLDIKSTTRGLLLPRLTQTQRNAVSSPATGIIIYQTDNDPGPYFNGGTPATPAWQRLGADNWGTQNVSVNPTYFTGNGTAALPLTLSAMGASAGQVLKFNGTIWDNGTDDHGPFTESTNPDNIYYSGPKYVGIGTNYPTQKLSIVQSGTSCFMNILSSSTGFTAHDGLLLGMDGLDAWMSTYENGRLLLGTNNTAHMVILANGNIGIGTLPAYRLDVSGQVNLNKGLTGVAMLCNGAEALWFNGSYFSWGYGGNYNYFGDNVTIGTSAVPGYNLVVNGTAAKTGGGSWTVLSDSRSKNLLGHYKKGLDEILQLDPVIFTYRADNTRKLNCDEEQVGFVAQEVQKIFPEAVTTARDGFLDFNIHAINVSMVNAIKEMKAENDALKARLEKLEKLLENKSIH